MKTLSDLLVLNSKQVVTPMDYGSPRCGQEMNTLKVIPDGAVAIKSGIIQSVDTTTNILKNYISRVSLDATNKVITPGLVDCHTHIVFAGSRIDEFIMRTKGISYLEIARNDGGIMSTVRATRNASDDELYNLGFTRINKMLEHGTTCAEAKSGYGLTLNDEIKQLKTIKRLNALRVIDLVPTFLGAHSIPPASEISRNNYINLIIKEMIPKVAKLKLARFCDVFSDKCAFSYSEAEKILTCAKEYGLLPKIHADEFTCQSGAQLAAKISAISADHLLKINDKGIKSLSRKGITAVLLPLTGLYLGVSMFAPARKLINSNVPVAIGTDFNPGSSVSLNMQLAMSIACIQMNMTPNESLTAATLNSAYSIGENKNRGSLEPGKYADLVIWTLKRYESIMYQIGTNQISTVIKNGKISFVNFKNSSCFD